MINEIPNEYDGLYVCSEARKKYMIMGMEIRLQQILVPVYERVIREKE